MPRQTLTSINNPLQIAEVPMSTGGGMIGVTFAPGRKQARSVTKLTSQLQAKAFAFQRAEPRSASVEIEIQRGGERQGGLATGQRLAFQGDGAGEVLQLIALGAGFERHAARGSAFADDGRRR